MTVLGVRARSEVAANETRASARHVRGLPTCHQQPSMMTRELSVRRYEVGDGPMHREVGSNLHAPLERAQARGEGSVEVHRKVRRWRLW